MTRSIRIPEALYLRLKAAAADARSIAAVIERWERMATGCDAMQSGMACIKPKGHEWPHEFWKQAKAE